MEAHKRQSEPTLHVQHKAKLQNCFVWQKVKNQIKDLDKLQSQKTRQRL